MIDPIINVFELYPKTKIRLDLIAVPDERGNFPKPKAYGNIEFEVPFYGGFNSFRWAFCGCRHLVPTELSITNLMIEESTIAPCLCCEYEYYNSTFCPRCSFPRNMIMLENRCRKITRRVGDDFIITPKHYYYKIVGVHD